MVSSYVLLAFICMSGGSFAEGGEISDSGELSTSFFITVLLIVAAVAFLIGRLSSSVVQPQPIIIREAAPQPPSAGSAQPEVAQQKVYNEKSSQAPCTYRRNWKQPRFDLLPEYSWG